MRNPNIPTLALTVTPQRTCTLETPSPAKRHPTGIISRAVFVSFMFPEEGLITRNVTFHLFFFPIQLLLFAQGWLPQNPSPRGPPNRGDRGDRSRRRSRARREWSGAPPSGGPSPLTGRTPHNKVFPSPRAKVGRVTILASGH